MAVAVLSADNIKKKFVQGEISLNVLQGLSVSFEQGKTYAIMGVSGTGKSTLMHILAGIDAPTEGAVYFNERNISRISNKKRDHLLYTSLGLVFQLPYLIKELSVIENVMLKGMIGGRSDAACRKEAHALLVRVDLDQRAESSPLSLSGGQQQRVAILRAIFNKPVFLLADEPTGNLDIETGKTIVDLLLTCQKEWGMGVIVSSHDAYVAACMEHIYHLEHGLLIKKG